MSDPCPNVRKLDTVETNYDNQANPFERQAWFHADDLDLFLAWFVTELGSGSVAALEMHDPVSMSIGVDYVRAMLRGRR